MVTYYDLVAKVCHEANRAICEACGDFSQKSWEDAEQWQRDSTIRGVKFRIENPDATPEDQHNAWLKDKIENGWVYGEVKDAESKTHPCLTPYESLPVEQKIKDYVFGAIVKACCDK